MDIYGFWYPFLIINTLHLHSFCIKTLPKVPLDFKHKDMKELQNVNIKKYKRKNKTFLVSQTALFDLENADWKHRTFFFF